MQREAGDLADAGDDMAHAMGADRIERDATGFEQRPGFLEIRFREDVDRIVAAPLVDAVQRLFELLISLFSGHGLVQAPTASYAGRDRSGR